MIDVAAANDRHGLETAVRMLREAGHDITVIHAPAVDALEVLTDVVPGQRRRRTELIIALRVVIDVMDAKQERIDCLPAMTERADIEDGSFIMIRRSKVRVKVKVRSRLSARSRVQGGRSTFGLAHWTLTLTLHFDLALN